MNVLSDKNGNRVCEFSDSFYFDPPEWWDTEGSDDFLRNVKGLRGRIVKIRCMVTQDTCRLKSNDPVMSAWIKSLGGVGCTFPVNWLRLKD